MNKGVILRIKAERDQSLDKAFKSIKDYVTGIDGDVRKLAKAFVDFSNTANRSGKNLDDVGDGAKRAKDEASKLRGVLKDLRSSSQSAGSAFQKSGQDIANAFKVADRGPAKISSSLTDLRGKLRTVGSSSSDAFGKLKDSAEEAADGAEKVEDTVDKATSALKRFAKGLLAGVAIRSVFEKISGSAIEFEAELRSLNTITEMSDEALAQYGENLRTLSLDLKTSTDAAQNARAAYDVASAGFLDASENAAVLEATLKAATAGNVEAADAARLIAGSLRAYGAGAQEAEKFTNVFFSTVKGGIATFPELSASLGNVTSIAAQAGISIEELGAAVATTTSRNIKTSQAVDGLRGAIANLQAPSEQAKKELQRLGIVVNEQTLKQEGLLKTLQKIAKANGGSAESFKTVLGDIQAYNAAIALTSDGGELFAKNVRDITNNVTALDDAVAEKAKSMQTSIDQFQVALTASAGAIGETFLPAGKALVDTATDVVGSFAQLPKPIRDFVTVLGTVAVAVGASVKVVKLLATATQLETIQLGLNTAAKALNTKVTFANTKATVASTVALGRKNVILAATTIQSRAAALSLTGLSTATLGVTASLAPLLVAGGALILWALKVKDTMIDAEEALDNYVDSAAEATAKLDDAFDSVNKSADQLLKEGKSSSDLLKELGALRQAGENIREEYQKGNLSLEARDRQLRKIADSVQNLRKKSVELRDEEKRRKKESDAAAAAIPTATEAKGAEDKRKELLAEELSRIEVLKNRRELAAEDEIKALNRVLETYKLNAEERRRIEERVAKITGDEKAKADARSEKSTKKELTDALDAGSTIPVDITKNQKGTQAAVDAYDTAISKVQQWKTENKALLKQFPEIGEKADSALEKLRANRAAAETERLSKNFEDLKKNLEKAKNEATSMAGELNAIDDQIDAVKLAQQRGTIGLQDAEAELAKLAKQRLDTEKKITQEKSKQDKEINAVSGAPRAAFPSPAA